MFDLILNRYKTKCAFNFKQLDLLKDKCNAPVDKNGVYLIYKVVNGLEILIYIGSSGQKKDGKIKTRGGGMKDRIVNGYHPNKFGQAKRIARSKAFPQQMAIEKITELKVYWWVTYDDKHFDFPTDIEKALIKIYCSEFKRLPEWHSKSVRTPRGCL